MWNGSSIRVTSDGGLTWQVGTNFGSSVPNHCRFLSFFDSQTGWAASPIVLGTTEDGSVTWTTANLPEGVTSIAAISLVTFGEGYLLDVSGRLHMTNDNGLTWNQVGALPLGDISIDTKNYPQAAMQFQDANQGVVIVSAIVNGAGQVIAFHTVDGGRTWTQEAVPARFGIPFVSQDGRFLTVLTPPSNLTILQYNGR